MSAGGISYNGVVGFKGKVTLPSAEMYNMNMNILRDPPKSITTRKIDKVGETSEITQMIQESGDRACESIMTYARGVNPMVSVSYNNYGNNGGQGINYSNGDRGRGQAYLPYRVMDKGAFRPPQRDQRDLYPLSRLPRAWTSSFTQPGFADFSKKVMCQGDDSNTKGVKTQMLQACVRPTATYNIQTPVVETYEVKNVIKNPTIVSGYSGKKSILKQNLELSQDPRKEINYTPLHADANSNLSAPIKQDVDTSNLNTDRYTHDSLLAEAETNLNRNIQVTRIDDLYGTDVSKEVKDNMNISYDTYLSGTTKYDYLTTDVDLDRVLPYHEARTNNSLNIHKSLDLPQSTERSYIPNRPQASANTSVGNGYGAIDTITSRNYSLKPTINAGGFLPGGNVPKITRENPGYGNFTEFDTNRSQVRNRVFDMQQERNNYSFVNA